MTQGDAGIGEMLDRYAPAFRLLDEYDHGTLPEVAGRVPHSQLDHVTARTIIDELGSRFPDDTLFGIERGDAFRGILGAVEQTFAGQDVYPSTQRKAAHFLYFVVKDHPFSDGNKRSAAALFTYYLSRNNALRSRSGEELVSNNALVALTLMTAMSKPEEKATIIRLLENMLAN